MAPTEEAITALVDHLTGERVPGQAREHDFTPWGGATNGTVVVPIWSAAAPISMSVAK
jgi:hypothetical protein